MVLVQQLLLRRILHLLWFVMDLLLYQQVW